MLTSLKQQGTAALVMVTLAILCVLGMIVLYVFNTSLPSGTATATVNTTITAFIAGLAIFGTFSTVTALIIAVKAIVGVVKGMQGRE